MVDVVTGKVVDAVNGKVQDLRSRVPPPLLAGLWVILFLVHFCISAL
jgi:hypothetical protein